MVEEEEEEEEEEKTRHLAEKGGETLIVLPRPLIPPNFPSHASLKL